MSPSVEKKSKICFCTPSPYETIPSGWNFWWKGSRWMKTGGIKIRCSFQYKGNDHHTTPQLRVTRKGKWSKAVIIILSQEIKVHLVLYKPWFGKPDFQREYHCHKKNWGILRLSLFAQEINLNQAVFTSRYKGALSELYKIKDSYNQMEWEQRNYIRQKVCWLLQSHFPSENGRGLYVRLPN